MKNEIFAAGGYDKTRALTVFQNHPVVGMVAASCSYELTLHAHFRSINQFIRN